MTFTEKCKFVFSNLWDFLAPFIKLFLTKAGPVLATAALSAVKVLAESQAGLTNSQKRNAAYNIIVDDLQRQGVAIGVDVTGSMVNAAIEAAVQKVKAS